MICNAKFPGIFLIFSVIIVFALCTHVRLHEGDLAALEFIFPYQNNFTFTIQIGTRYPFYYSRTGTIYSPGLTEDQVGRFSVQTTKEGDETTSIHVQIVNTTREDAGTYICLVTDTRHAYSVTIKRIALNIDYTPGKASCTFETVAKTTEGWAFLTCTALLGSQSGLFDCYQECEKIPPRNEINQNRSRFWQTFWVRKSLPGVCCTSLYTKRRGLRQCDDFKWNFLEKPATDMTLCLLNGKDTYIETSESPTNKPLSFTSKIKNAPFSTEMGDKVSCTNINVHWEALAKSFICISLGLGIVVIFLVICLLKQKRKNRYSQNHNVCETVRLNMQSNENEISFLSHHQNTQTDEVHETQNSEIRRQPLKFVDPYQEYVKHLS
ncbi:uncharacterized protein LOC115928022 [Strongylocentrotus purpuratus]|uniref:Immunoglobulin-like beta-sandwich domain-containing protein n=1 Tax=Strongylocentrotus purpuratus TaxID=7668 RepID=A0A7M7PFJ6_STRPU|nr:uncharacterized protein LOC115928022 [Strongylocentrotus purpuratus]